MVQNDALESLGPKWVWIGNGVIEMNLVEKYDIAKNKYPNHIVFIKSGNFWYTFKKDTIICKYVFNYSLKNKRICFPNSILNKNLSKLRKLNISYIIVYELNNIIVVDNMVQCQVVLVRSKMKDK